MAADNPFSRQLLAADSLSTSDSEQLQQELSAMFRRELSTTRRTFFGAVAMSALVSGGICGALALTEPELPTLPRVGLGVGALFGLAWAIVGAGIAQRGSLDLKRDPRRIATMVWSFTVLMMTFFLVAGMGAEDRLQGLLMIAGGIPFLIGAGVYWLNYQIEQADLNAKEKFLMLELQLAELRQRM